MLRDANNSEYGLPKYKSLFINDLISHNQLNDNNLLNNESRDISI